MYINSLIGIWYVVAVVVIWRQIAAMLTRETLEAGQELCDGFEEACA